MRGADEQHRRLVALALADDDGAVERQLVQRVAHGGNGSGVGCLFVAPADHARSADRCIFRHTDHFEHEDPVEDMAGAEFRAINGHGRFLLRSTVLRKDRHE